MEKPSGSFVSGVARVAGVPFSASQHLSDLVLYLKHAPVRAVKAAHLCLVATREQAIADLAARYLFLSTSPLLNNPQHSNSKTGSCTEMSGFGMLNVVFIKGTGEIMPFLK